MIKIERFKESDFDLLYDFMKPIWFETYGDIISKKQIEFLLDKYFSPNATKYYKGINYQYFKIDDYNGVLVIQDRGDYIYLDKIYFNKEYQSKGYFKYVINYLESMNKDIILNVNQKNLQAIKAYQKQGFEIIKEERIVLDNDMINIDYVMKKSN